MKKLLLVLLFVPLVSFSQEQVLNGISLNGPKDFVKSGDYTWTKGNDLIMVQSYYGTKLTKEGYISSCKRGSRSSKYVTNITQEISGVDYIFCIQEGDNSMLIGQTYVYRNGYTFLITCGTSSLYFDNDDSKAFTNLFYMFGYMITRVTMY